MPGRPGLERATAHPACPGRGTSSRCGNRIGRCTTGLFQYRAAWSSRRSPTTFVSRPAPPVGPSTTRREPETRLGPRRVCSRVLRPCRAASDMRASSRCDLLRRAGARHLARRRSHLAVSARGSPVRAEPRRRRRATRITRMHERPAPQTGPASHRTNTGYGKVCPQEDSNLRPCLRRAVLYPLSYGGQGARERGSRVAPATRPAAPPSRAGDRRRIPSPGETPRSGTGAARQDGRRTTAAPPGHGGPPDPPSEETTREAVPHRRRRHRLPAHVQGPGRRPHRHDKVSGIADKATGSKHADKIQKARQAADDQLRKLGPDGGRGQGHTPPSTPPRP